MLEGHNRIPSRPASVVSPGPAHHSQTLGSITPLRWAERVSGDHNRNPICDGQRGCLQPWLRRSAMLVCRYEAHHHHVDR